MWPILRRVLLGLVLLIILIAGGGYLYLRQSLPQTSGTITVNGISAPIRIVRDADAIPHIFAATRADALYGLGYVHAQDRLWQMEFQRRIGHGRLSEVFGAATLPQDQFLRTVGFGRAANEAWRRLPEDVKKDVNVYVSGVNAFIETHHGRKLPPEFQLLWFEPEPFTGPDVIVWVKMMAWDLSANYSLELMRHDLFAKVGARMNDLLPPYPDDALSIVADDAADPAAVPPARHHEMSALPANVDTYSARLAASLAKGNEVVRQFLLGGTNVESVGSNNWVVDGTLTASGKPLLANDPHLGTHIPSLWYLAHMSAGDFDVIGATLPGAPAMAIGRNRFIAWGETNVAADVQDLYAERISADGTTAEFQGRQEPIRIIPETIKVSGGAPVTINVRVTRHGPLISDGINAVNAASNDEPKAAPLEPLALRWTALDEEDTTVTSFLRLNDARNWNDFTAAMRLLVTPSQNFVYADVDGHIGYYAPGHIPVRSAGDGSRPVPGWTGKAEWTGWVPFEELPHLFDPPSHAIVTANHRPMPATYPHLIALEFPDPYRAERITDLLKKKAQGWTVDDFSAIQGDTLSLHAQRLMPVLLAHTRTNDNVAPALDILRKWDYNARADSAAEAIFEAWFLRLAPALVGDELGPVARATYEGRFSYITRFVLNTLGGSHTEWCDNVTTPQKETCDDSVTTALSDALRDLRTRMGNEPSGWRWDKIHNAVFPHQGLDSVGVLKPILSRAVPNGGDWSTVNVGPVAANALYEQRSVPGYRQIIDLSPANDSRFLDAVGESGHFLSPHYDDYLADWSAVRHKKMRTDRKEIEAGAIGTLTLTPHGHS
jgi:penicillin G amidase